MQEGGGIQPVNLTKGQGEEVRREVARLRDIAIALADKLRTVDRAVRFTDLREHVSAGCFADIPRR